ncbi:MAG: ATPase domain-containing protein [Brevundimonas sp.]|uniref:ATPase domain-containing protein n=1 Tax=Brevundimonas sp. TaxID=1871086 RepID=UPI00391DE319
MPSSAQQSTPQAAFGIAGLDDILSGGLERDRVYLLEGNPGTGKTTGAMRFLIEGADRGEPPLYITLSETEAELRSTAESHGWSLDGVEIFELVPPESLLDEDQQQSLLYSSDLELGETTRLILDAVERVKPSRVVIDSLSEIRLLAQGSLRYRRQVLALKHYFAKHGATVLLLDDLTTDVNDKTVHSVAHGVIQLNELAPEYGSERRRLRVIKYRARKYRGGYHDFVIRSGGLEVFPRIIAAEHRIAFERVAVSSGIPELDTLLGGGIERGSSALILGPAGTGKSLFAIHFAVAAIARGERAALFLFDEELGLLFDRMLGMGIDLAALQREQKLIVEQIDAGEMSPGEFAIRVKRCVSEQNIQTVVIDSLNGYRVAMPEEQFLILHIRELLQYLNRQGASTFLTVAQHGLVGSLSAPVDVTYLADTVVLLRYFESAGTVRRAASVIKKRSGQHEKAIREYTITEHGLKLGAPLAGLHGILRGVPDVVGSGTQLMESSPE